MVDIELSQYLWPVIHRRRSRGKGKWHRHVFIPTHPRHEKGALCSKVASRSQGYLWRGDLVMRLILCGIHAKDGMSRYGVGQWWRVGFELVSWGTWVSDGGTCGFHLSSVVSSTDWIVFWEWLLYYYFGCLLIISRDTLGCAQRKNMHGIALKLFMTCTFRYLSRLMK